MKLGLYGVSALLIVLVSPLSFSESSQQRDIKTNRYSYTTTSPSDAQYDLLSVVVSIRFPATIKTVGEALEFILMQSGYRLDDSTSVDDAQYYLYTLKLPESHRAFDTVNLKSVLDVLGNESYTLLVNPVKRTVSYQLREDYREYIHDDEIALAKSQWQSRKALVNHRGLRPQAQETQKAASSLAVYGPVVRGESLSSIAYSLNHYEVNAERIMTAIYLKNPASFLNENINLLIAGTKLQLPRKGFVHSISATQAAQLVELHYRRWRGEDSSSNGLEF